MIRPVRVGTITRDSFELVGEFRAVAFLHSYTLRIHQLAGASARVNDSGA